jgi:hypothetical protein
MEVSPHILNLGVQIGDRSDQILAPESHLPVLLSKTPGPGLTLATHKDK